MIVWGILGILIGAILVGWPYEIARVREQIDSIGSARSVFDVEPADWHVEIVRLTGVLLLVGGLGAVVFGVIPS
jgi:uncharacterized membrane protein HdeD (DUF308 family)